MSTEVLAGAEKVAFTPEAASGALVKEIAQLAPPVLTIFLMYAGFRAMFTQTLPWPLNIFGGKRSSAQ